jgi:hypothetical protein
MVEGGWYAVIRVCHAVNVVVGFAFVHQTVVNARHRVKCVIIAISS